MGLFSFFSRKKYRMSDFAPGISEDELHAVLPDLTQDFMNVVQTFSMQFYREVHSHEAGAFPGVREEFFFLIYFISQYRIKTFFDREPASRAVKAFRLQLTGALLKSDCRFNIEKFWSAYRERETSYTPYAPVGGPIAEDGILETFNSHLVTRLNQWEVMVTHFGAEIAREAITYWDTGNR
jgi:hypothetical protein